MKQPQFTPLTTFRKTFSYLFITLVIVLMLLPFVTTFDELLTRIVEKSLLYKPIQTYLVPYEIMLVRTIVGFFGVKTLPATVSIVKNNVNLGTFIAWNCIGWQSFVILLLSFWTGFESKFTLSSRIEAGVIGILGTFFLNLFRICIVLILLNYFGSAPATVFHDWAAVLLSIIWLFLFWWFSFKFVLEERSTSQKIQRPLDKDQKTG